MEMCEFNVLINGETVFKDAVYAKVNGNKVILKDVLGVSKEIENCKIVEVDVNSERLVLSSSS
jgi:predicted RNA-binding protein